MQMVKPAQPGGLSAGIGQISGNVSLAAAGLGVLALLLLGPAAAIAAVVWLALLFVAMKWLTESQIGGQTGDVARRAAAGRRDRRAVRRRFAFFTLREPDRLMTRFASLDSLARGLPATCRPAATRRLPPHLPARTR